jgi:hypothetical protein
MEEALVNGDELRCIFGSCQLDDDGTDSSSRVVIVGIEIAIAPLCCDL